MFTKETIPLKFSRVLNPLVSDYLSDEKKLAPFYHHFPNEQGFKKLIESLPYSNFNRNHLSTQLEKQAKTVHNTSELSYYNIQKLKLSSAYTVTTGHQLCLFTGPLYFIYKIISTINLAERLHKKFPNNEFVPVYWMASEDHDFQEVNHFHTQNKVIQWNSKQTGAVGNFNTKELESVISEVKKTFGVSKHSKELCDLFESAYLNHTSLSAATRYLVNALFGDKGIVIIDGDDKEFKKQFVPHLADDLFEHKAFNLVNKSIAGLQDLSYSIQVKPRQINCFYHASGIRKRIEKQGEVYQVVESELKFTKAELEQLLTNEPEKISPNVILRPLYQQVILPNLAYVGGPGELAYWLEFAALFEGSKVLFPILMPRNFVLIVDKLSDTKRKKLNLNSGDLFKSENELIHQLQLTHKKIFNSVEEIQNLQEIFSQLNERVSKIDKTLIGSVAAGEKKALNQLEQITKKANKALRRSMQDESRQLNAIKQKLFPDHLPQERHDNFSSFYLTYGKLWLNELYKHLDPFTQQQVILNETGN